MGGAWTAHTVLPGGDLNGGDFNQFTFKLKQQYPWLSENILFRYAKNYGTIAHKILDQMTQLEDLGQHFGAGCYAREIEYLVNHEWAQTCEDIIWRRSKLGLYLSSKEIEELKKYIFNMK